MIVPYAPGGGVDIMGRIVGARLSERLGVQVVVENRGGGGTVIGTEAVAKAPADGYTLLFGNPALSANPALNDKLPYDTLRDLAPVIMVAASFNVLVVHPSLPVKTVRELVALAKSKPGQLNYASAGEGSAIYLAMAMFQNTAGIDVVHIPYKGAGPALIDVVGGQVPMMFIASPPAVTYVNSGKLRGLAVSGIKRLAVLPDIPTIAESGYRGFEVNNWYGVLAPGETPRAVVGRLNTEINALIGSADVRGTHGGARRRTRRRHARAVRAAPARRNRAVAQSVREARCGQRQVKREVQRALVAIAALQLAAAAGAAERYPARAVRFVIASSVGSGVDIIGRIVAAEFAQALGQQFVADNRPGAGHQHRDGNRGEGRARWLHLVAVDAEPRRQCQPLQKACV